MKNAGFLPEERAYFDRFFGAEGDDDYNAGAGLGWVDIGRTWAGEVDGPYTWWSQRGKAFDTDTGWRIDYQLATPGARRHRRRLHGRPRRRLRPALVRPRPVVVDYAI